MQLLILTLALSFEHTLSTPLHGQVMLPSSKAPLNPSHPVALQSTPLLLPHLLPSVILLTAP